MQSMFKNAPRIFNQQPMIIKHVKVGKETPPFTRQPCDFTPAGIQFSAGSRGEMPNLDITEL